MTLCVVSIQEQVTDVCSRDFLIWKINFGLWAVAWTGLWEKGVWDDYEQLLRPVFSLFWGHKLSLFKKKHYSLRNEKLHRKKAKKNIFRKTIFFQG